MKKKISNFLILSGRKKILENFLSLGFVKGTTLLLPLLIIPHLMSTIGIELIGLLALITAICAYLNTVIDYGFSYTGTREVAKNNFDSEKNTQLLVDISFCKTFLSIIGLLVIFLSSTLISFLSDNFFLIFFSALNIIILSLCPSWFFQGLEDMKKIAVGEVLGKILSFLLIIFYIDSKDDIILIPIFYLIGQIFSLIIYMYFLLKYVNFSNIKITTPEKILLKLKKDWNMFVNILFPNFYNIYSYIILGFFGTLVHVGVYDIVRKIMNFSEQALGIVSKVYFPVLSKDIVKFKEFLVIMIALSLVIFVVQVLFTLYGLSYVFKENFELAQQLMYIQNFAPLIYALMIAYGINFLGALGEDKILRNITIITSILGFIIVTLLTYLYMAPGALLGIILTWLIRFIFSYLNSKKISSLKV